MRVRGGANLCQFDRKSISRYFLLLSGLCALIVLLSCYIFISFNNNIVNSMNTMNSLVQNMARALFNAYPQ